jgi:hypothetical protein
MKDRNQKQNGSAFNQKRSDDPVEYLDKLRYELSACETVGQMQRIGVKTFALLPPLELINDHKTANAAQMCLFEILDRLRTDLARICSH